MRDNDHLKSDDSMLLRSRGKNLKIFLGTSVVTLAGPTVGAAYLTSVLFKTEMTSQISLIAGAVGLGAGMLITIEVLKRSVIINSISQSFTTVDSIKTIRGEPDPYETFGPGTHIAKWWSGRESGNSISLNETSVNFDFSVLCQDGLIEGSGSFRLRADIRTSVTFISGYRAVGEDIASLIEAFVVAKLAQQSVRSATSHLPELNLQLNKKFVGKDGQIKKLEERYGIHFSDVTITKLLVSKALTDTIGAQAEAEAIARGTAILLGMTYEKMKKSLDDGRLSYEVYKERQDRFLAISGNLQGMNLSRSEFSFDIPSLEKLDQETMRDIAQTLPYIGRYLNEKGGTKK